MRGLSKKTKNGVKSLISIQFSPNKNLVVFKQAIRSSSNLFGLIWSTIEVPRAPKIFFFKNSTVNCAKYEIFIKTARLLTANYDAF